MSGSSMEALEMLKRGEREGLEISREPMRVPAEVRA